MSNDSSKQAAGKAPVRRHYHHGNLVDSLVAAAIELIEEKGVEQLSVREVAKKAGVSPGAPFRHFSNKNALLTAVAEQAISRLTEAVETALQAVASDLPLERLRAIGIGYLDWALANPTHFQIVSSRSLINFHESELLVRQNADLRQLMVSLIAEAQARGDLRPGVAADDLILSSRAFVYGVVRMWIDGHFQEWQVEGPPDAAMHRALDLFITQLSQTTA
jgi:AcrR family transcriptional regulator